MSTWYVLHSYSSSCCRFFKCHFVLKYLRWAMQKCTYAETGMDTCVFDRYMKSYNRHPLWGRCIFHSMCWLPSYFSSLWSYHKSGKFWFHISRQQLKIVRHPKYFPPFPWLGSVVGEKYLDAVGESSLVTFCVHPMFLNFFWDILTSIVMSSIWNMCNVQYEVQCVVSSVAHWMTKESLGRMTILIIPLPLLVKKIEPLFHRRPSCFVKPDGKPGLLEHCKFYNQHLTVFLFCFLLENA